MSESGSKACHLCSLPTELLFTILTYLPAKELTKCRRVCQRWRWIIDGLQRSDSLWREYSRKDFPGLYMTARINSKPGLLWFNIYRSLSLWPRLDLAKEERDEFAFASNIAQEIVDVRVLNNGILGVHRKQAIVYYDLETLAPAARGDIAGNYLKYTETTDTIIIQNFNLHLFIVRKVIHNPNYEPDASFENIRTFLLVNQEVYYVTLDDEIFVIDLGKANLAAEYIARTDEGIMCLGHSDRLNVLTLKRNIYSIIKDELVHACTLDPSMNLFCILKDYNFLEGLDWRVYFQWMFVLRQPIPQGPLRNIVTVKTYGNMVFVGTKWGVLRIYHAQNEFDLFSTEPIKQYNFMERQDCPVLSDFSPIVQIDVMEDENGHMVIVAMPKKIAVLTYTHNFKRSSSVAMLPYTGSEAKVIKINQCI